MSVHDDLVASLVSDLENKNYTEIHADLKGYDRPGALNWNGHPKPSYIPDIIAFLEGVYYIFEIETSDAIGSEHSDAQWKIFAAKANEENGHFYIYVEDGAEDAAKARVKELEITAHVI